MTTMLHTDPWRYQKNTYTTTPTRKSKITVFRNKFIICLPGFAKYYYNKHHFDKFENPICPFFFSILKIFSPLNDWFNNFKSP